MASKRNALSSLIPGLDPRLCIGFYFHPTYEDGIRIVEIKNAGEELLRIFEVDDDLFRRPPGELEECYCFTTLKRVGKNKVKRKLQDGSDSPYWKNIETKDVVVNNSIGCVTKLRLHEDKNTPTEWHILEYRDRKTADADRYVLCRIYKTEKKNDNPHVASDVGAGQISSSTSQVSSMNQQVQIHDVGQYGYPPLGDVVYNPQQLPFCTYSNGGMDTPYFDNTNEMGQGSNTQPDWDSNGPTYSHLNGEYMNQDQFHGVDQTWFPGMVYNPQPFTLYNTNSIGDIHPISGFDQYDWNRYYNADLDTGDFDMD